MDAALQVLSITSSSIFSGPIGKFMKHIEESPNEEALTFLYESSNPDFGSIQFKSHKDLDDWCYANLKEIYSEEDRKLLKAFDRVFWLRWNQGKKERFAYNKFLIFFF